MTLPLWLPWLLVGALALSSFLVWFAEDMDPRGIALAILLPLVVVVLAGAVHGTLAGTP